MDLERRKLKRKPLLDCTNITNSSTKTPKPSISTKKQGDNSFKNTENPRIGSQLSTPLQPKSSTNSVVDNGSSEIVTYCSRKRTVEKTKDKGKEIAVSIPFSCPPAGRIKIIGDELNKEFGCRDKQNKELKDVGPFTTCTIPCPKGKKKRRFSMPEKHVLPQDFIERQRAYFAEIDAFKLQEEVASESELE